MAFFSESMFKFPESMFKVVFLTVKLNFYILLPIALKFSKPSDPRDSVGQ